LFNFFLKQGVYKNYRLAFGLIESIARLRPQLRAAIDNQQDTVASNITRLAASMISTHSQTLVAHCSDPNVHQLLLYAHWHHKNVF